MTFSYAAFSSPIAALTGWAAFGASVSLLPWEAIQITDILGYLIPRIKQSAVLYTVLGSEIHLSTIIIGVIFSFSLYLINIHGLKAAATFQRYLVILLVLTSLIGAAAALIGGKADNLFPLYDKTAPFEFHSSQTFRHASVWGGIFAVFVSAPFFLAGFETIPQGIESAGGNVKKVGKTVVLSVACACLFYALLLICFGFGLPWKEFAALQRPATANLFLILYPSRWGTFLYWIIISGAIAGLMTSWNGFFSASANILMGMSRGRLLPKVLQKQAKNGVAPHALTACLLLSCAGPFLGTNFIDAITCFSASAFVLSWSMTAWSLVRLRLSHPDAPRPYRIPGGILMALFAAVTSSVVLLGMFLPFTPFYVGKTAMLMFLLWMSFGILLFAMSSGRRKSKTKSELLSELLSESGDVDSAKF